MNIVVTLVNQMISMLIEEEIHKINSLISENMLKIINEVKQ